MARINYSRQRECIRSFVMSSHDHPTADMVYHAVKEQYPSISLGTVYRNLSFMADRGEIKRVSVGGNIERFDGNTKPHYHFLCRRCGRVEDLPLQWMAHIDVLAGNGFNGEITGHDVLFYGNCEECKLQYKD